MDDELGALIDGALSGTLSPDQLDGATSEPAGRDTLIANLLAAEIRNTPSHYVDLVRRRLGGDPSDYALLQGLIGSERFSRIAEIRSRKAQAENASKDRPDALQSVIMDILRAQPKATSKDVLDALKNREHTAPIESVMDDRIEWTDDLGRLQDSPTSGIAVRVSRARKKLKISLAG